MQKLYNVIVVKSVAVYAEDEEEAMNVYDFGEEYEAQESIFAFPINEDDTINDFCDDNLYMSIDLLTQAYLEDGIINEGWHNKKNKFYSVAESD